MIENPRLDIGPVVEVVYDETRNRLPRSDTEICGKAALDIVYDALGVLHVEGDLWSAFTGYPPDSEIYQVILEWFPQFEEEVCMELAEHIAFDVLGVSHVLGELWTVHAPGPTTADGEVDQ